MMKPHSSFIIVPDRQQSQPEVLNPSILLITAVAQPTPVRTERAPDGQLRAHAPHSMQESLSDICACPLEISNTPLGHTIAHMAQPEHASGLSFKVTTSLR